MMTVKQSILISFALLVVGGCVTMPTGPSVAVYPAPGKPFEVFQQEDNTCRQWAQQSIGGASPQQMANQNTAAGAAVGTAVGAGLGAAVGSLSGHAGAGAVVGGVSGLLVGTSAGAQSGQLTGRQAQRRYDNAYLQCMYSYGNQVPGYRPYVAAAPSQPAEVGPPPELPLEEAPQFVYSPELELYVAGGVPYDIVYTGNAFFYFYGRRWYRGPYYYGPWVLATGREFPPALLRYRIDQIRHYRNAEFRRYEYDRAHYDRRRMYRPENRGRREMEHR